VLEWEAALSLTCAPCSSQGKYDNLTFWEQLDDGLQYSTTRKFLTAVPVVLFLLASHSTEYARQPLALNLIAVLVMVIAKLPVMDRVRILGMNSGYRYS